MTCYAFANGRSRSASEPTGSPLAITRMPPGFGGPACTGPEGLGPTETRKVGGSTPPLTTTITSTPRPAGALLRAGPDDHSSLHATPMQGTTFSTIAAAMACICWT